MEKERKNTQKQDKPSEKIRRGADRQQARQTDRRERRENKRSGMRTGGGAEIQLKNAPQPAGKNRKKTTENPAR